MKVLITGVKGQLGFDLVRELKSRGYKDEEIVAIDYEEMDITKEEEVIKVFDEVKPEVVYHCAAFTAVDKAEDEEFIGKCFDINVFGTANIAKMANKYKSKLVYISTDYVFDGEKTGYYEVDDKVSPKNVYGMTKYLGEYEASKYNDKTFVVRVSWVFGINGNNFIKTMLKLAETKTELNIVSDQVGSPTYTVDLSRLLVDMTQTEKYGIYHATNEEVCSWAEFAEYIFKVNNIDMIVNKITSDNYPQKAKRPINSKMSKSKLDENGFKRLPSWMDAVDRYSMELKGDK